MSEMNAGQILFKQATEAHAVHTAQSAMTQGETVIAEKLHGILSLMMLDHMTRLNQPKL